MKCKNCNNESIGRSRYCSDTCRVSYNRNKKRNTETVTSQTVTGKSVTPEKALLRKWADGGGTSYQRLLGRLALHYDGGVA